MILLKAINLNYIHPAKQVTDQAEIMQIMEVALSGHFAGGVKSDEFRKKLQDFLHIKHVVLCNSGSSANLLAASSTTSPKFKKQMFPGDEVITAACGFPTTVNPTIQNGFKPVFIDCELGTYVPTLEKIEEAITEKTRAIFLTHTLGNLFPVEEVQNLCDLFDLVLIEDCCDALGSRYNGKLAGTFGDFGTLSFYPAHMISCGEGGAVYTRSSMNMTILESFRDWGRACWCAPGCDNTCGKRFSWEHEGLPFGFDHKYTYEHIGYNLKMSDLNAAIGVAQMDKLEGFIEARKRNHTELFNDFHAEGLDEWFILPKAAPNSDPVWFGFCLTIENNAPFSRRDIVTFLEEKGIGTRQLFGGNLLRHPAYRDIDHRVSGSLRNSDKILIDSFWFGCHPAIGNEERDRIVSAFFEFTREKI